MSLDFTPTVLTTYTFVPLADHGLLLTGHNHDPDAVIAAAKSWLVANANFSRLDAHNAVSRPGAVGEGWWGGDERGFVGENAGGEPVTVINVHMGTD